MTIRISDLRRGDPDAAKPTGTVQVIVKVRDAGYVPPAVKLRARVDEHLFTADVEADALSQIERDPQVVSVSRGKKLRLID